MPAAERIQSDSNFTQDLQEIDELQTIFDSELRLRSPRKIYSYNPVLERWKFGQVVSEIDEIHFRTHEEQQVKTTLKERLRTTRSVVFYKVDGREAFNEHFPDEPFERVLKRGIAYRKSVGSEETEREQAELDGCMHIFENLTKPETPILSKFIVISGPGFGRTSYPHNFVDIYEKVNASTGEITIRMTRTASQTDYEKYGKIALQINPGYFDGFTGPLDAWFLSHPIPISKEDISVTPDEIFDRMFDRKLNSISDGEFEEVIEACMPLILNYINVLCQDSYDPKQIAIAFNAVLNKADIEMELIRWKKEGKSFIRPTFIFGDIKEEAHYLGTMPVRELLGGCGPSAGFGISELNSVAGYAVFDETNGWHTGICTKCNSLTLVGGCNICATCVLLYYSNN